MTRTVVRPLRDILLIAAGLGLILVHGWVSACERVGSDLTVCEANLVEINVLLAGVGLFGIGLFLVIKDTWRRRADHDRTALGVVAALVIAAGILLLLVAAPASRVLDCTWAASNLNGACDAHRSWRAIAPYAKVTGGVLIGAGSVAAAGVMARRRKGARRATG